MTLVLQNNSHDFIAILSEAKKISKLNNNYLSPNRFDSFSLTADPNNKGKSIIVKEKETLFGNKKDKNNNNNISNTANTVNKKEMQVAIAQMLNLK